ncbi:hypothetical protein [Paraburkholderia youngii]|uniref:hypothetical protein n=1 Tax=Paraburkholderia youngii TaxID=2782701 RepID=UPI003D25B35B
MNEKPSWLKRSENGTIGEARARSFLLERFWVLERSIDKDGADYLIQRRLTTDNFLSREAPRLGVVQVKFLQDDRTAIYIEPEYVCEKDGKGYSEFFLLIHTGAEDEQRQFLLTARDILSNFKKSKLKIGGDKFYIPGAAVLGNSKYQVVNLKRSLDSIEHALKNADFVRNRAYFGASQYIKVERHHIDEDYLVNIDNGYCDIDKEFFEQKRKLQSTLFDLQEVVDAFGKILRSTDPLEAFEIYEKHIEDHIGSRGLEFRVEFFDDEDFRVAAKNHKDRLTKLRELNLENSYLDLLDNYEREVMVWIMENKAWKRSDALEITAAYRPEALNELRLSFQEKSLEKIGYPVVTSSRLGSHTIIIDPSSLARKWKAPKDSSPEDIIASNAWQIRRPFQKEIDTYLLGEELVSPWM